MLRYRQKLVKMRTIIKNSLQALAIQAGLSLQVQLFTQAGIQQLASLVDVAGNAVPTRTMAGSYLSTLNQRISAKRKAGSSSKRQRDPRISRLRTHPGIGLLTLASGGAYAGTGQSFSQPAEGGRLWRL